MNGLLVKLRGKPLKRNVGLLRICVALRWKVNTTFLYRFPQISLIVLVLVFHWQLSLGQSNPRPDASGAAGGNIQNWKEFSPRDGGFRILFPKPPSESFGTISVGKTSVGKRTYSAKDGNTYSVMYFDVPAAGDRNMVGDFLVGLRNFVLDEFKGDLLTDSPISINDNEGRLLEMSIPNQGVAIAIILVANSRLYRIAVVAQKAAKTDANTKSITTSFFDSFRLLPIDRSKEGEVDSYIRSNPELAKQAIATEGFNTDLNLKALSMPRPRYPPLAHGVHASGTVIVKVIIDEQGNVMAAQATSGHPLLQPDAVDAARKARFPPRIEAGKPVKALGRLTYNFVSL